MLTVINLLIINATSVKMKVVELAVVLTYTNVSLATLMLI